MLKKVNRLAKAKDIQKAFARGRTFFNPFFTVKFAPSPEPPRFTVVVSTKVFKKAVSRNRLKRIIREYLRKNLNKFKKGNYIIMVKPKISKLSEADSLKSFLDLCLKLK
jgi:ribonuclease P protein component